MPDPVVELLDVGSVGDYLRHRGTLPTAPTSVRRLGGGVSNVVLLVDDGRRRVVVKQALPRLLVGGEWLATRERTLTEAAALEIVRSVAPEAAPRVLDVDADARAVTIEAAPPGWRPWKDDLLAGRIDCGVATRLGSLLREVHRATQGTRELDRFDCELAFEQLRVDPYYREVARRHPELAPHIERVIDTMLERRVCLVHGDFSPKNVLVGVGRVWLIDPECAHVGDPAFDVAFLVNHLLLKSIHRPSDASSYRRAASSFLEAYGEAPHVTPHLACLLLARVDGKSPADYLTGGERRTARRIAIDAIEYRDADPLDLWREIR